MDITALATHDLVQLVSLVAMAVVGAVLAVQRVLKSFKETSAENSVVSMMHEELVRLSANNQTLSEQLSKFQVEILALNRQLNNLSLENQRLHNEIQLLTSEVAHLQYLLRNPIEGQTLNTGY